MPALHFYVRVAGISLAILGSSVSASSFGGEDEPNIVCKASPMRSDTYYASSAVANNPDAARRFRYHADRYGKSIGDRMYVMCKEYAQMTPEEDAMWRPGSYRTASGKTITVEMATFLPSDWSTDPTPDEIEQVTSEPAAIATTDGPRGEAEAADAPGPQSPAPAAERSRSSALKEAELQAKHAQYERDLEAQQAKVAAFEKAKADVARQKADAKSKADAAAEAYAREREAHDAVVRKHEEEAADYKARSGVESKPQ